MDSSSMSSSRQGRGFTIYCLAFSQIFPAEDTSSFHRMAREYLLDRLDGLDPAALLSTKRMIQVRFESCDSMPILDLTQSFLTDAFAVNISLSKMALKPAPGTSLHRIGRCPREKRPTSGQFQRKFCTSREVRGGCANA